MKKLRTWLLVLACLLAYGVVSEMDYRDAVATRHVAQR